MLPLYSDDLRLRIILHRYCIEQSVQEISQNLNDSQRTVVHRTMSGTSFKMLVTCLNYKWYRLTNFPIHDLTPQYHTKSCNLFTNVSPNFFHLEDNVQVQTFNTANNQWKGCGDMWKVFILVTISVCFVCFWVFPTSDSHIVLLIHN